MKATYVRAGATFIAMPIVGWFCFQAASIYFTIQKMWLLGYTWQGFLPYAWASAILGSIIVFGLSWITRPKNVEPENSLSKKEMVKLERSWSMLERFGSEEDKQKFYFEHPQFFSATGKNSKIQLQEKAEAEEQTNFLETRRSLSPIVQAPTSPLAYPLAVSQEGNELVIRLVTTAQNTSLNTPIRQENNGFNKKLREQIEALTLIKLQSGEWEPEFTLNLNDGIYELPKEIKIKKTKQPKSETKPATPEKPEQKTPILRRPKP